MRGSFLFAVGVCGLLAFGCGSEDTSFKCSDGAVPNGTATQCDAVGQFAGAPSYSCAPSDLGVRILPGTESIDTPCPPGTVPSLEPDGARVGSESDEISNDAGPRTDAGPTSDGGPVGSNSGSNDSDAGTSSDPGPSGDPGPTGDPGPSGDPTPPSNDDAGTTTEEPGTNGDAGTTTDPPPSTTPPSDPPPPPPTPTYTCTSNGSSAHCVCTKCDAGYHLVHGACVPKGNNGVGNGLDPQPPGNPPVNDGPGTSPGNPGNKGKKK